MENLNLKMHGAFTMTLTKENGEVETTHKDNLIVNGGFDMIADAIFDATRPAAANYIALGTNDLAVSATQTGIQTPLGARRVATYNHTNGTKVLTLAYTFQPGESTGAIKEAAIYNHLTAGKMLDRVVFPVVNKGANDTLTTTFTLTMS